MTALNLPPQNAESFCSWLAVLSLIYIRNPFPPSHLPQRTLPRVQQGSRALMPQGFVGHSNILTVPTFQVLSLQRKLTEVEAETRATEKELVDSLAESHSNEKKLRDELHTLEMKMQQASVVGEGLQLHLSTAEGRLHGLEAELAKAEAARREAESKLGALHSALRRTLGLGRRSPSPQRPCSPSKGQQQPWCRPEECTG